MRDRVGGRAGYRPLILFDGAVFVAFLTEQQSEIEVRLGVALLDIDRFLVFGDRAIRITTIREQDGITIVRFGIARVQTDSFSIVSFRRNWVAFLLSSIAVLRCSTAFESRD